MSALNSRPARSQLLHLEALAKLLGECGVVAREGGGERAKRRAVAHHILQPLLDRLRREAEEAEDRLNGLPDDATPEEVADARRERDLADARADVAESALDVRGGGVGPDLAPASNGGGPQQQGRPPGSGGPGQRRWVRKGKAATRVNRLK